MRLHNPPYHPTTAPLPGQSIVAVRRLTATASPSSSAVMVRMALQSVKYQIMALERIVESTNWIFIASPPETMSGWPIFVYAPKTAILISLCSDPSQRQIVGDGRIQAKQTNVRIPRTLTSDHLRGCQRAIRST